MYDEIKENDMIRIFNLQAHYFLQDSLHVYDHYTRKSYQKILILYSTKQTKIMTMNKMIHQKTKRTQLRKEIYKMTPKRVSLTELVDDVTYFSNLIVNPIFRQCRNEIEVLIYQIHYHDGNIYGVTCKKNLVQINIHDIKYFKGKSKIQQSQRIIFYGSVKFINKCTFHLRKIDLYQLQTTNDSHYSNHVPYLLKKEQEKLKTLVNSEDFHDSFTEFVQTINYLIQKNEVSELADKQQK